MDETLTNISDDMQDHREELTDYLRSRLIECGWRDRVANMCRDLIQARGVEQVKLSHLVNEVKGEAKLQVPESVRNDVLGKMRKAHHDANKQ